MTAVAGPVGTSCGTIGTVADHCPGATGRETASSWNPNWKRSCGSPPIGHRKTASGGGTWFARSTTCCTPPVQPASDCCCSADRAAPAIPTCCGWPCRHRCQEDLLAAAIGYRHVPCVHLPRHSMDAARPESIPTALTCYNRTWHWHCPVPIDGTISDSWMQLMRPSMTTQTPMKASSQWTHYRDLGATSHHCCYCYCYCYCCCCCCRYY